MSVIHSSWVLLGRRSSLMAGTARCSTVRSIAYSRAASASTASPVHSRRPALRTPLVACWSRLFMRVLLRRVRARVRNSPCRPSEPGWAQAGRVDAAGLLQRLGNRAGAEAPEVSFEVAGAVPAVAVAVAVGLPEQVGAGGLHARVVGVDVADGHVDPSVAKVAAMQILGAVQLHHGSPASGSHNRADLVEEVAFESERLREPGHGGSYVTIGQRRIHRASLRIGCRCPARPAFLRAGQDFRTR